MEFNQRSTLEGRHAFLSPSNYHWINYTDQKLEARFISQRAAARGTDLHNLAHACIKLRIKLAKSDPTLSKYVSDGIGYNMVVEQPLFYSENCFGHADTICFRRGVLRIHDLKTGVTPTSVHQLEVYAALFCLEYSVDPFSIRIELRIYQSGEVQVYDGDPNMITSIMETIVDFDNKIEQMKEEL